MGVPPDRERLLAAVERSPQAAAAHDRAGWVALFTDDGRVEDPVGSRPHVGREQIGRFYDTFIGPRDIKFHRDLDIVFGTVVLRDLELEVSMGIRPSPCTFPPSCVTTCETPTASGGLGNCGPIGNCLR